MSHQLVDYAATTLNEADRQTLEWRLVEFDRGWTPERLTQEVGQLSSVATPLRRPLLAEMVKIDLERQWGHGRRPSLEAYLRQCPDLGGADNVAPELIQAEYEVRRHFGEADPLPGLCERFPRQAAAVRRLLEKSREIVSERELSQAQRETVGSVALTETFRPRRGSVVGLPENFGRYRIIKSLGKGGMGAVYLAHDKQLDRQVALKVPHFADEDGPDVRERFYREARAAATLSHPNLCPVYDVGEHDGIHFLTMAYIDGHPLSHFIKSGKPQPQRQVAAVVRKLALALEEAHRRGVIHRDLKPANIMIDRRREPVVMDFGLARRANSQDARLTQSGMAIGTPAYMPPEQVRGDMAAIGAGCDIYSLGVILYELLTGRIPFRGNVADVLVQILTVETPPPSQFRPDVDPRLAEICLKAMSKRVEDRYAGMGEFAGALTEYLRAAPAPAVDEAETPSAVRSSAVVPLADELANQFFADMSSAQGSIPRLVSRQAKFARRSYRRNAAIAGGLCAAAAIVLGVVLIINGNRVEVPDGSVVAVKPNGEIQIQTPPPRPDTEGSSTAASEEPAQADAAAETAVEATETITPTTNAATIALDGSQPTGLVRVYAGHAGAVYDAVWLPGREEFLSAGADATIRVWNAVTGQEVGRFAADGHTATVFQLAVSADGRRALSASFDQTARLWDIGQRTCLTTLVGHQGIVYDVDFFGADQAITCGEDGGIRLWNLADHRTVALLAQQPPQVTRLSVAPDGGTLATGGADHNVNLYALPGGLPARSLAGHRDAAGCVAFSPDGSRLASGGYDHDAIVHDVATGEVAARLVGHTAPIHTVAFVGDRPWLLSSSHDGSIRLWDVDAQRELLKWQGHTGEAYGLALSANGKYVLSTGQDGTIRLWRLPEPGATPPESIAPAASAPDLTATKVLWEIDWREDAPRVLDENDDRVRGVDSGGFYYRSSRAGTWAWNVVPSPSRQFACELVGRVAAGGPDDAWMVQVGTLAGSSDAAPGMHCGVAIAVTAGGTCRVESSVFDKTPAPWIETQEFKSDAIRLGNAWNTLRVLVRGDFMEVYVNSVAICPPIRLAREVTPSRPSVGIQARNGPAHVEFQRMTIWDGDDLPEAEGTSPADSPPAAAPATLISLDGSQPPGLVHTYLGHTAEVHAVAFSADGRRALSGGRDNTVRYWDLETSEELTRFEGHTEEVLAVAFAPDGEHALSAGVDQVVRVWRLSDGQQTAQWQGHAGSTAGITVLANGKHVSTTGEDGVARLWDWSNGRELSRIDGPWRSAVTPDGRRALTSAADGTLRVYDGRSGTALRQLVGHTGRVLELAISRDGRHGLTSGFDDETVRLWDLDSGEELRRLVGHAGKVLGVAFTPDGRRALTACGGKFVNGAYVSDSDQSIRVWDVETGTELAKFLGHSGSVRDVICSPDGPYALSSAGDRSVRLWRLPDESADDAVPPAAALAVPAEFQPRQRTPEEIAARRQEYLDRYLPLLNSPADDVGPGVYATQFPPRKKSVVAMPVSKLKVRHFADWECQQALDENRVAQGGADYFKGYFDDGDRLRQVEAFDARGVLHDGPLGTHRVRFWYGDDGQVIQETYFDDDGKAAENRLLYATARHAYEDGRRVETRFYDSQHRPSEDYLGVHRRVFRDGLEPLEYRLDGSRLPTWLPALNLGRRINQNHAWHPCVSPDGRELYFATTWGPSLRRGIHRCEWKGDRWTTPEPVLIAGQPLEGYCVAISSDGLRLAFMAWNAPPYNPEWQAPLQLLLPNYGRADIYIADRIDGSWGNVRNAGPAVNAFDEEGGAAFVPGGYDLLVSRKESDGNPRMYLAAFDGQTWAEPKPVGVQPAQNPLFSADGRQMFFVSNRKGSVGYTDIWMTQRAGDVWTRPVNLGAVFNSVATDDGGIAFLPQGDVAYFARCYRPWHLLVTGRADSDRAIRHMADIYALGEWE